MSEYLFAYGTLQPDQSPDEIVSAVARLRPVGEGFVRGKLYDCGDYPGAVLDPSSKGKISGTVFRLPKDETVLRKIDEYEEFDPRTPDKSLFVRRLHTVELAAGKSLQCWVYVYNQKPKKARALTDARTSKLRANRKQARQGAA
ncbi:MAG TPA: gamma-glutamylcyclotransferase family protein [Acidobacteriaceae bacterium]|nr:gamma-glutamylcyclotransferase family protein [Acidobacteriaceae bacterium]